MLPPQVPMPRPATTPPASVAADQFHALAARPPAIEWFPDITNTNTRRAQRQDIRDFEAFAGLHQPEQFRDVTHAHGIAWPNHLVRQGVAATVLSGVGWALLIGIGTGHGVCLHMSVAILRVWR